MIISEGPLVVAFLAGFIVGMLLNMWYEKLQ